VVDAVRESGFELVEVATADVRMMVGGESGEMLSDALAHESGFVVIYGEAFFQGNGGDVDGETVGAASEVGIAGEGEVVGVAGVGGARTLGESGETGVQMVGAEVRNFRGSGCTLREMAAGVEVAEFKDVMVGR
jgi:hypothetical protein